MTTILKRALTLSRVQTVALVVVLAVLGTTVTAYVLSRGDDLPDDAVLRVDGTTVTEADLDRRVKVLRALYGIERPTGGSELASFNRDAAKAIAVGLVLDEAAQERRIAVPESRVRETLDALVEEQYGPNGGDKFVQQLGREGASERDVLDELERQLQIDGLFQEVTEDAAASVTETDLRAYFERHRDAMRTSPERRLRNIVVAAQGEAAQVARLARAGQPFSRLVRRFSLDESTREADGDLGFVTKDMLEADYATAAFQTDPGNVFGPLKSSHGWNIGLVVDAREARPLTFEGARPSLQRLLVAEATVAAWRDWLENLLRDADVQYADDYRPDDPLEPPGEMPSLPAIDGSLEQQ